MFGYYLSDVFVVLKKPFFADGSVIIGAEDGECERAVCVPVADHGRAETRKEGPGAPLEDVEQSALH